MAKTLIWLWQSLIKVRIFCSFKCLLCQSSWKQVLFWRWQRATKSQPHPPQPTWPQTAARTKQWKRTTWQASPAVKVRRTASAAEATTRVGRPSGLKRPRSLGWRSSASSITTIRSGWPTEEGPLTKSNMLARSWEASTFNTFK